MVAICEGEIALSLATEVISESQVRCTVTRIDAERTPRARSRWLLQSAHLFQTAV